MSHRSSPRPSSMGRRPVTSWLDQEVHTGWYRVYATYKRSRIRSRAKRMTRRRERAEAKRELRAQMQADS